MTYPDKDNTPSRTQNAPPATLEASPPAVAGAPQRRSQISHAGPSRAAPTIPSKRQLDDLLTSLNARPTQRPQQSGATSHDNGNTTPDRQRRALIEPFGPVGQSPPVGIGGTGPRRSFDGNLSSLSPTSSRNAAAVSSPSGAGGSSRRPSMSTSMKDGATLHAVDAKSKKKPAERVEEPGYAEMPFGKALPILTELLEDDGFKSELKKMKKEQDSLERRLWAKGEKIKADHENSLQAEKEVAKIARRPIDPAKKATWAQSLASSLNTFYLEQCLPPIDSLASKHKQRLIELGVPGLGSIVQNPSTSTNTDLNLNSNSKSQERIRRIMELLEAGSEE
ncbi:hypothetical protein I317_07089 [Kwoniella heveanensis CBS 569]|nr:hypothetical protein I317_07089 [Kwoniella heveanensis CBS 569]